VLNREQVELVEPVQVNVSVFSLNNHSTKI